MSSLLREIRGSMTTRMGVAHITFKIATAVHIEDFSKFLTNKDDKLKQFALQRRVHDNLQSVCLQR